MPEVTEPVDGEAHMLSSTFLPCHCDFGILVSPICKVFYLFVCFGFLLCFNYTSINEIPAARMTINCAYLPYWILVSVPDTCSQNKPAHFR